MAIAVDSDVKYQTQKNKDTPHTRMTYMYMYRSTFAYLQAFLGLDLPANALYSYKELIIQSIVEGKDQELIQQSIISDPGHHMIKQ